MHVRVTLGDDLADQDGVGLLLARPLDQVRHRHLGAEVHDLQLAVVLQALLTGPALDVEDRVDADGVGVGADAGPDDDELAVQGLPDGGVGLLGAEQRVLPLEDLDRGDVDDVADRAVDDEEREAVADGLGVHDHRGVHAHPAGELGGGALGALAGGQGQGERQLHHPVAGGVAVGTHHRRQAVGKAWEPGPGAGLGRTGVAHDCPPSRISLTGLT